MLARVVLYLFGYSIKYVAAGCLTGAVLPTVVVLMMGYTSIWGPQLRFVGVLSLFLPIDAQGNGEIHADDIMRAFGLLTLIMAALAEVVKAILRLLRLPTAGDRGTGTKSALLRGLKAPLILTTIIFAASAFVFGVGGSAQAGSKVPILGIAAFLYVIAMVSTALYKVFDKMADFILAMVRPDSEIATI